MIVTDLPHLAEQVALTPALRKALRFLDRIQGQALTDGRIEIDGANAYALVQSYETLYDDVWMFEGHRTYLDIQYIAVGEGGTILVSPPGGV